MLREPVEELVSAWHLEVVEVEARSHRAHDQRVRSGFGRRSEPPPALDERHRPLSAFVRPPQYRGAVMTARIDHVNGQGLTVIEVPQFILLQPMECRDVLSLEEEVDGGRV